MSHEFEEKQKLLPTMETKRKTAYQTNDPEASRYDNYLFLS
jgi:hypothetical protein